MAVARPGVGLGWAWGGGIVEDTGAGVETGGDTSHAAPSTITSGPITASTASDFFMSSPPRRLLPVATACSSLVLPSFITGLNRRIPCGKNV